MSPEQYYSALQKTTPPESRGVGRPGKHGPSLLAARAGHLFRPLFVAETAREPPGSAVGIEATSPAETSLVRQMQMKTLYLHNINLCKVQRGHRRKSELVRPGLVEKTAREYL